LLTRQQDFFGGREPGRALNSEECIAKGCALAAAIISPTFKVRDFAVIDSFVFPVNLSWATHAAAVDADAMDTGATDAAAEKKGDGDIFKQYGPLPVTYVFLCNVCVE
jgi:heat shock protein 4